ncbi:hypothetical protein [Nonlabens ulvanivorans]|uniref:C1q domain-containing protein n=1 Tax=Nonlabens ulvanivorans TaxID=906888 RepID=A0ABX5E9F3_NONUL|nr:hypothetical protein [Nonlabens ulvanivorans]PRX14148.1 hypothetical protein LY02_01177 [Nonlabens ulvanivorans]
MNSFCFIIILSLSCIAQAQVGVGTVNPQNDLHVAGGLRIDDAPSGTSTDAQNRLLARDSNGDVVNVTIDQAVENVGIPQLAFNAKFGSGGNVFFSDCIPCATGQERRFHLELPQVNINNTSLVELEDPTGTTVLGDEYFEIKKAGFYRFEVNSTVAISGSSTFFINLYLNNLKLSGTTETDSFRIFGGIPRGSVDSPVSVPFYATDIRYYDVGDQVSLGLKAAVVEGAGSRELFSILPIDATYIAQITITKY